MENKYIPMIFIAVRESKYPKVTRRREFDMIADICEFLKSIGFDKVCTTRNVEQLKDCDGAFFRPDYYKDPKLVLLYNKCRFKGIGIFVGGAL